MSDNADATIASNADFLSRAFDNISQRISEGNHALPTLPPLDTRNYHHADYQYEVLIDMIKEFEKDLDDEHEIAVKLASFGQSITLNVTDIGYSNPSIIVFYGYVNGQYATLIQHVSQLSFLLVSVPKAEPDKPARRIGFDLSSHKNEQ